MKPSTPHSSPPHRHGQRGQRGIALIEAMVGMVIFAFGVLGVAGLQAAMTKAQTASRYRAQASNLANELLGRMWSDTSAQLPNYATTPCQSNPNCTDWLAKLRATLPDGDAQVDINLVSAAGEPPIYATRIELSWQQPGEQGGHRHVLEAQVQP